MDCVCVQSYITLLAHFIGLYQRVVTVESVSNYFRVRAPCLVLWLSCSFVWWSASNNQSMECQKKQCKKSEAAETSDSYSALFNWLCA